MGFLESLGGFIEGIDPLLARLFPMNQVILNAQGQARQAPVVTQAGIPGTIAKGVGGLLAGSEIIDILGGLGGNGNGNGRAGGVTIAGVTPGLYHTTAAGKRVPNRISYAQDDSGRSDFYVWAGNPTAWSRVSLKKSKPRHHHHRP